MTRRFVILLSLLGMTTLVAFLMPRMSRPLDPFAVGLHLLEQDRPTDAVHLFAEPQWRGVAEYRAGRYHRAVAAFAVTRDARGLYNLGTAYAQLGTWDGAKAAYQEALQLDPGHPDAQHNLEVVLRAQELERQQIAALRDERKLGHFDAQNQTSDQAEVDNEKTKDGDQADEKGEIAETDRQSARGGQSDLQGTPGDEALSPDAQSGGADAAAIDQDERDLAVAPNGTTSLIRRDSSQALEILLRQIEDDPARVLKSRLRTIHLRRQRERR